MTPRPAVSAHRGGSERADAATWEAYKDALESGAEYVEFDIRRTADGVLVVYHDPRVGPTGPPLSRLTHAELSERAGYDVPVVDEVMALIAGRLVAHLDLKEVGYEQEVVDRAVALLGVDGLVVTTLEDRSLAAVTRAFPGVRTALSLGRDRKDLALSRLPGTRLSELFPARRIRACGAHGVAVHQRLARTTVLREATRRGLFTMVWTVNDDTLMRAFLAHPRVDVLVTDRPRRAVALRGPITPSRH
ncbi:MULTISPECIES: glycerophosphodiester phosphodiesterase family protein [Streptomyces]|uniref:Glycerophosphodiester phosphodiesterase n=1 Tax=Streptomyces koelreuteriae TaxID=2838015 RepID=A0ABX8FLK9_9ACTN|nr:MULTISPECIES: glycerophosphodiester phosphodiesterase family protein [Streptomyces]QWB22030.1 glycerophosphodiester phosphodiesterase [Streptomyces koelreuteriae]UUA04963.1 glycerophosphodiester phosphodiesterase [Streptomyces koelreuteriae]UUA12586.1 glycerophosphodiester phosphodiesterase [Streptomyces sp. CRCS-T-1]